MKPIVLLGEAWGENEAKIKRPFVGASGVELLRLLDESGILALTPDDREYINKFYSLAKPEMLDMVWTMHPEVYRTNVFNLKPAANKIEALCGPKSEGIFGFPAVTKAKYVRAEFASELERLADELIDLDPNLIICFGNTPLWALAGKTGVGKLRGTTMVSTHTATGFKLLPTYHPAAVLRQWEHRPIVLADLAKAKREAGFPEVRRPKCEIWIEPGIEDIERFINEKINGCRCLAVDIETAGDQITCIGFAPSPEIAINIPFYDGRTKTRNYWPSNNLERKAWALIADVLGDPKIPKSFQNGLYDIAFLLRAYGIRVVNAKHDTMLLHHALQPESLKGLAFLGSVYTDHGAWKDERKGTTTIKRDE